MVKISIETIGEERFIRGFNRIPIEIADMSPIFQDISLDFYRREKRIFARQGDPAPFDELTNEAYKKWKARTHPGKKIMQLTGRLRLSLVDPDRASAGDVVKRITKQSAEFGTVVPYANGNQMGRGGLLKRMIVQWPHADKLRGGRRIHRWRWIL